MAYEKQIFSTGQVLTAAHLNHMEDGIEAMGEALAELEALIPTGGGISPTIGYATLLNSKWVGDASPYSQVVNIEGVTVNSQVDLTPSVEQLAIFYDKDLAFVTENEDGVVTVYAIGQKPENDYTIQVTITEVVV